MRAFAKGIVKSRIIILILSVVLLFPAAAGYFHTKVNYDLLVYLPDEIDTMKGQDILKEEFGTGAFCMFITEGMQPKETVKLKEEIAKVEHVKNVLWYDSALDLSVPMQVLPENLYEAFNNGEDTMMIIIFDDTTSADGTVEAVRKIRTLADERCFLAGMTAVMVDTEDLSNREAPIYVGLAVLLSVMVLSLTMDSFLIPFLFLASIGIAIVYNLGTNLFLGHISYVTKALAAVLQLGVTMDYSIFLWHSYEEETEKTSDRKLAMENAIVSTISSIVGSSITTVAGFIALCFMSFSLGMDLGVVMAKGVLIGVVACVTILPSMILIFDRALEKTKHKPLLPDIHGIGHFVTAHYKVFLAILIVMLFPAIYGYRHTSIYYNLDSSLPRDLLSVQANTRLDEDFNMGATHVLMVDAGMKAKDVQQLTSQVEEVAGVKWVLGLNSLKGAAIPDALIPDDLKESLLGENWQLLMIGSEYAVASDEVNDQCETLESIAKEYDENSMLIGEAPCTKDLIRITDRDFNTVSMVSIGVIFIIILLVFRSLSIPAILVAVIESGIFVNMGIPFYTGTELPFVASIVIGTIQLGSTVDYAILMTTRYRRERLAGTAKKDAVEIAVQASVRSIMVSAFTFFAATFGVGIYSTIDMISSLCTLMARGALISMACVIFLLPSLLMVFDGVIGKTTWTPKTAKERPAEYPEGAQTAVAMK